MATKPLSLEQGLFSRQTGIIHPEDLDKHIMVIGAGGIGSWTTLALAKMGVSKITSVDFDTIEQANIAPQFYGAEDDGKFKCLALAEKVNKEMGKQVVQPINRLWEDWEERIQYIEDTNVAAVIMAVDSMSVRKNIWEDIKYAGLSLIVDGRMAREMMEVLIVDPSQEQDIKHYEEHLFPSDQVEEIPCTERAVAYNQFVIAGLIGSVIKQFAKGELLTKRILFDLFSLTLVVKN